MSIYIALGYNCNHACLCCPLTTSDRLHKPLSLDTINQKINEILKQKDDNNHIDVIISGGEPFLNQYLFHVLEKLLINGCFITILTNSTQLTEHFIQHSLEQLLRKNELYRSKLHIVTAIHSHNAETHDYITGVLGSFSETIKGLDWAISQNISVTIKIILNKINMLHLVDTIKFLDIHFPIYVKFQVCGMDYSGNAEKHLNELLVSFKELKPYVENAIDYLEKVNSQRKEKNLKYRNLSLFELPLCMCDPYYWRYFILPSTVKQMYVAPNDGMSKMSELSIASMQCGTYYDECTNCTVKKICHGVWKSSYYYINDLIHPIRGLS